MRLSADQDEVIRPLLPVPGGNVRIASLDSSMRCPTWRRTAAHGARWPERFGNRPTIYPRLRRWAAAGVLDRVIQALQAHRLIRIRAEWVGLGSTSEGPPRWAGRSPKNRPQAIGRSRGGWTTKIDLVAAKEGTALTFARSPGQAPRRPRRTQAADAGSGATQVPMAMEWA